MIVLGNNLDSTHLILLVLCEAVESENKSKNLRIWGNQVIFQWWLKGWPKNGNILGIFFEELPQINSIYDPLNFFGKLSDSLKQFLIPLSLD